MWRMKFWCRRYHGGIALDTKHAIEQGDSSQQEKKLVREALISVYKNNISTRLKIKLCSLDNNNYSYTKDVSTRNGVKFEQWCTSWMHQFKVLLMRQLRVRRYEIFNRLRIFQVVTVAFLAGLLWWHTPISDIEDRSTSTYPILYLQVTVDWD